jgi:hypothetical protein
LAPKGALDNDAAAEQVHFLWASRKTDWRAHLVALRHYIPKSMPHYRSLRVTSHRAQSDFKVFKRRGDIQDWKVRCVCEKCNNGWMRASIDEPARPIMVALIDGAQTRIMPEDQRKIASWAVLKAMVAEYDAGAYVTTSHMQRKYLMRRHVPPTKGWAVWIGHHVRTAAGTFHWGAFPALILPDRVLARRKSRIASHYNSNASSLLVGELFIHVMRSPHHHLVDRWRLNTPDGGALYRIWPSTNISTVWPPKSMSAEDIDYAIGALKKFLEESAGP